MSGGLTGRTHRRGGGFRGAREPPGHLREGRGGAVVVTLRPGPKSESDDELHTEEDKPVQKLSVSHPSLSFARPVIRG